jgi:hypothetical protein
MIVYEASNLLAMMYKSEQKVKELLDLVNYYNQEMKKQRQEMK